MADSRVKDVYNHLKQNGIDVYFPGVHQGDVKTNEQYVVVRGAGGTRVGNFTSTVNYIELLCYVSIFRYSDLDVFCDKVENIMLKQPIWPMIANTYTDLQDFQDDEIKGYMRTKQYKYNKQIKSSI